MMFRQAARWGMINANPFEGVKAGSQHNRERLHYVTPETAAKLIDSAPNPDWRCIIALARWGGLRCPSEVLRVRWVDVDWNAHRLRVTSPKTEEHAGKGQRIVPLFPELRVVLMEALEQAGRLNRPRSIPRRCARPGWAIRPPLRRLTTTWSATATTSVPHALCAIRKWAGRDSNPGPLACNASALAD